VRHALVLLAAASGCTLLSPYPSSATELDCHDDSDEDRDGLKDCLDEDCALECFETGPTACADGEDNDGDGRTDGSDAQCWSVWPPGFVRCVSRTPRALIETGGDRASPVWVGGDRVPIELDDGGSVLDLSTATWSDGRALITEANAGPITISFRARLDDGVHLVAGILATGRAEPGLPLVPTESVNVLELTRSGATVRAVLLNGAGSSSGDLEVEGEWVWVSLGVGPVDVGHLADGPGEPARLLTFLNPAGLVSVPNRVVLGVDPPPEPGAHVWIDDVRIVFDDPRPCPGSTPRQAACGSTEGSVLALTQLAGGPRCAAIASRERVELWSSMRGLDFEPAGAVPLEPGDDVSGAAFAAVERREELALVVRNADGAQLRVVDVDDECGPLAERTLAIPDVASLMFPAEYGLGVRRQEQGRTIAYIFARSNGGAPALLRFEELGYVLVEDASFLARLPARARARVAAVGDRDLVFVARDASSRRTTLTVIPELRTSLGPVLHWVAAVRATALEFVEDPASPSEPDRGRVDGLAFDEGLRGGNALYSTIDDTGQSRTFVGCVEYSIRGLPSGFCNDRFRGPIQLPSADPACNEWESCRTAPRDCGPCAYPTVIADLLSLSEWERSGPVSLTVSASSTAQVEPPPGPGPRMLAWERGQPSVARVAIDPLTEVELELRTIIESPLSSCSASIVLETSSGEERVTWLHDEEGARLELGGTSVPVRADTRERLILSSTASRTGVQIPRNDGCSPELGVEHGARGPVVAIRIEADGGCAGVIDLFTVNGQ